MSHPLVIVGAGPIGLAAAAHAQSRGLRAVVLEAGPSAGSAVRQWGHVRLFSAWGELVDPVAERLLQPTGWTRPDPGSYPTGLDWAEAYLSPLAVALASTDEVEVRYGARVVGVAKHGRDRMVDAGREEAWFTVHVATPDGLTRLDASAVIDASGTWGGPNPLGGEGLPAIGEAEHAARITYGIPDFDDPATRARYAGQHVAVAGTGASAQNTLVGLSRLAQESPDTKVSWLVRRAGAEDAFGGGDNDQLEARGALGKRAQAAVESGPVDVVTSFRTAAVHDDPARPGALVLTSIDGPTVAGVDEVIVVTGFRPDLSWLSEVRLDLDPVLSAPTKLAPLIDPNVHSCGTVYPHGAAELAQPEAGLYLAGMKSYGRAPSFLALTGFEQTRSIVAAIDGDVEAASRVELVLPESGVCGGSGQFDGQPTEAAGGACCAPSDELLTIGGRASSCG
jgi:glycine/D-amino acid oxidase-like deaminating enzyme